MKKLILILILCSAVLGQYNGIKPMLGEQVNWAHPQSKGLVGLWLFNEGSGNKVFDLSGNGNVGTFNGGVWVPGSYGTAVDLEAGSTEYIGMGDKDILSFAPNNPFSIVVKCTPESTHQSGIVSKSDIPNPGEYYIFNNNDDLIFRIVDGSNRIGVLKSNALSPGESIHIIAVYDGSAAWTGLKLFINGQDSGATESSSGAYTAMDNRADSFNIGLAETFYFDGLIEYVYLYNRVLSVSEIAEAYYNSFCMLTKDDIAILEAAIPAVTPGGQVITIQMTAIPLVLIIGFCLIMRRKSV